MATKPTQPDRKDSPADILLALFCLALSLLTFFLALVAMYATCRGTRGLPESCAMLLLAAALAAAGLCRLLLASTKHADEASLHTAWHLLLCAAKQAHVSLGLYAGGWIAVRTNKSVWLGWLIGGLVALALPFILHSPGDRYAPKTLRGTILITPQEAKQRCAKLTRPGEATIRFGPLHLPERLSEQHFLIVGATGSGKTVIIRLFMDSVIPSIIPGGSCHMVVYDAKQDTMEILSGSSPPCEIIILNPFDQRSVAWDMARDITTPAAAIQAASHIIADEPGPNSFFSKAARDLFAGVLIALHNTRPGAWTLADVVKILSRTDLTTVLLETVPYTRQIAAEHFGRGVNNTTANVQYTISANIAYLRPIAALWAAARRRFSLQEWIDGNSILVLGNSETLRTPIDALNRAIFQRLVELVLAQPESTTRRTWFFLDELKEMGKLDALPSLLTKGRSKGVRAVLAFQTIEGLKAVYGDRLAAETVGMCANKLLLRTDSPETAQWASSVIGEAETLRWMQSHQSGKGGNSESISQQILTTQAVLASELLRLPLANRECFHSFCVVPAIGIWRDVTPFARDLRPKGTAANFVPRPDSDQYPSYSPPDDEEGGLDDITRMTWETAPKPPEPDL